MKLKSLDYAQHEGTAQEWKLHDLALGDLNLLVGKNASGKTRALNVINALARLLSHATKLIFSSGNYDVTFDDGGRQLQYKLHYENKRILSEHFTIDGRALLRRGPGGAGTIFAEQVNSMLEFQTPDDELAAVARQDSIQHPFFAPLLQWAQSVYHYPFGTPLGKDQFALIVQDPNTPFDRRNPAAVVAIFRRGSKEYGAPFTRSIIEDMGAVGYPLEDVGTQPPTSMTISGPFGTPPVGLYVKEQALAGITDQPDMSQGMFRALSVIIQVTYAAMSSTPSLFLIDDIGEGLDFERSCLLIKLLLRKASQSHVQVIMATNDRFVMNTVPLESWSLLERSGGDSRVFNYANSKAKFDDFKFTGMNNFDFFATDFLAEGAR